MGPNQIWTQRQTQREEDVKTRGKDQLQAKGSLRPLEARGEAQTMANALISEFQPPDV